MISTWAQGPRRDRSGTQRPPRSAPAVRALPASKEMS